MRILITILAFFLTAEIAFITYFLAIPARYGVVDMGTAALIQICARTLLTLGLVCSAVAVILARMPEIARRTAAVSLSGICGVVIGSFALLRIGWPPPPWERVEVFLAISSLILGIAGITLIVANGQKAAEPGATDNPDDAQRLREDH